MAQRRAAERHPQVEATSLADWRAWLERNHAASGSVWLIAVKTSAGGAFTLDQAVEEALCFGWIDSLPRKLDDRRTMLLFSPRKPGSNWSAVNKARIEALRAQGRMAPAGLAAVERAVADGSWTRLDQVEALEAPPDLVAALDARPPAREVWEGFPRSVKRGVLEWILNAKRAETRAKRVAQTAERAQRGERANQWRG